MDPIKKLKINTEYTTFFSNQTGLSVRRLWEDLNLHWLIRSFGRWLGSRILENNANYISGRVLLWWCVGAGRRDIWTKQGHMGAVSFILGDSFYKSTLGPIFLG